VHIILLWNHEGMKNGQTTRDEEDDGSTRSLEELEDTMKYRCFSRISLWLAGSAKSMRRPCLCVESQAATASN
jgi:hypothetical protein